tara:strand:- start:822 stop:1748 length:927 start_codon:yes stop_codon:yes gene_type:complete
MAFKLKSGNSPMFKKVGEEKETAEQYNAKVRAEYEAKLRAHSDSTASYNKAVIIDDLYKQSIDTQNLAYKNMRANIVESERRKGEWKKKYRESDDLRESQETISSQDYINKQNEYGHRNRMTKEDLKNAKSFDKKSNNKLDEANELNFDDQNTWKSDREKFIEKSKEAYKTKRQARVLEKELTKDRIYPTEKRKLVRSAESEFTTFPYIFNYKYNTTAHQVKPGPAPTKPMEMIDRMKIKNIDMGEPTPSGVIEPSKRKYMTSDDGKYKYNLETGERSKVNTQKVKNTRRPGKRSVKNLVTGGTNRVQ